MLLSALKTTADAIVIRHDVVDPRSGLGDRLSSAHLFFAAWIDGAIASVRKDAEDKSIVRDRLQSRKRSGDVLAEAFTTA